MKNLTDREIVLLYSEWSETFYAASFRTLSPHLMQREGEVRDLEVHPESSGCVEGPAQAIRYHLVVHVVVFHDATYDLHIEASQLSEHLHAPTPLAHLFLDVRAGREALCA